MQNPMIDAGLLTQLELTPGSDAELESLFLSTLPQVVHERVTFAWFAVRFGRSEYGIFDVFPNEAARAVHLAGPIGQTLMAHGGHLLTEPPRVNRFDVLANKMPAAQVEEITKGLLLTFEAKSGHEPEVEAFLRAAQAVVEDEPKTIAWFAIRTSDGRYGIFDVFPDNGGRFAHLAGHVPRELAKHALTLLGSMPEVSMFDVKAAKIAAPG